MDIGVLRRLAEEVQELQKLSDQVDESLEKEEGVESKFLLTSQLSISTLLINLLSERIKVILRDNNIVTITFGDHPNISDEPISLREYISKLDDRTTKLSLFIKNLDSNKDLSSYAKGLLVTQLSLHKALLSTLIQQFNATKEVDEGKMLTRAISETEVSGGDWVDRITNVYSGGEGGITLDIDGGPFEVNPLNFGHKEWSMDVIKNYK